MGRPPLNKHERRAHSTRADLTFAEKQALSSKARLAGVSEAELLRRFIRDGEVVVRRGGARADPALITEINRLSLELKAVGNNANQLALSVHTDREFRGRWREIADAIASLRSDIADALWVILQGGS